MGYFPKPECPPDSEPTLPSVRSFPPYRESSPPPYEAEPDPFPEPTCSFCGKRVDLSVRNWVREHQVVFDGYDARGYLCKKPGKHRYTHAVCGAPEGYGGPVNVRPFPHDRVR